MTLHIYKIIIQKLLKTSNPSTLLIHTKIINLNTKNQIKLMQFLASLSITILFIGSKKVLFSSANSQKLLTIYM